MDGDLEGRVVWYILVVRILRCIALGEENMAISKEKKKPVPSTQYFYSLSEI